MSLQREAFAFGAFVLDPAERRLNRGGEVVPLTGKAFSVLVHLVERHGQLVTREELLNEVWDGVNVDDAVITVNISALRKVLGDDRNGHSFVETVPRAGYRFIAPVERVAHETAVGRSSLRPPRPRRGVAVLITLIVATVVAAIAWIVWGRPTTNETPLVQRQVTANPLADPVARGAISPDGRYLAYSDLEGLHIRLVATGATRLVPPPPGYCFR